MNVWLTNRKKCRLVGVGLVAVGLAVSGPAQAADSDWTNSVAINGVDNNDAFRSISVSGVNGLTTDVSVTLLDVSQTWPDDMDILLSGPGGRRVVLMSDSCGSMDVAAIDITVDDEAGAGFPDENACAAGTYRPTNHLGGADAWALGEPTGATMAAFDGIDPNGTWTLEVGDDSPGEVTKITGGWQLHLTTTNPPLCFGLPVTVDLAKGQSPTGGSDVIRGTAGNDTINGLGGNDTICGLGGDDIIQGGAHDDVIIGGAGRDTASYASSPAAVTVTLATGSPQSTGVATGSDSLKQVEDLYGSSTGSDTLTGNALDNGLFGLGGNDTLKGAAGLDKLVGGPGTDDCNGGVDIDTAATCEVVVNVP